MPSLSLQTVVGLLAQLDSANHLFMTYTVLKLTSKVGLICANTGKDEMLNRVSKSVFFWLYKMVQFLHWSAFRHSRILSFNHCVTGNQTMVKLSDTLYTQNGPVLHKFGFAKNIAEVMNVVAVRWNLCYSQQSYFPWVSILHFLT